MLKDPGPACPEVMKLEGLCTSPFLIHDLVTEANLLQNAHLSFVIGLLFYTSELPSAVIIFTGPTNPKLDLTLIVASSSIFIPVDTLVFSSGMKA